MRGRLLEDGWVGVCFLGGWGGACCSSCAHIIRAVPGGGGREVGSCLGGPVEHRAPVGLVLLGGELMCWGLWLVMGNIAYWKQWDNGP